MHAALLVILARINTHRFAVTSHSNGLLYVFYTLLYMPPTLTATSWTRHGPLVQPSISGCVGLRLAAPLLNALGALMQLVPPLARAASWRGEVLDEEEREACKPPHRRGYVHRHHSGACRTEIMRRAMAESRVAVGQEALFCLHGADKALLRAGDGDEGGGGWNLQGQAPTPSCLREAGALEQRRAAVKAPLSLYGSPGMQAGRRPPRASGTYYAGQYISARYAGHGMPCAFACAERLSRCTKTL
ncbi:hypothetical protein DFH09DRAFT_1300030 [Mycena vulgaris]|nr:hypothetical protein DFH09DRAFT_1300030 [Mycena vulgaris]